MKRGFGPKETTLADRKPETSRGQTSDEASEVLTLAGVRLVRDGSAILDGINWHVRSGERWVVLGPNGSGKTTLCQIITLYQHPHRRSQPQTAHRYH